MAVSEDTALVEEVLSGSQDACRRLVLLYQRPVFSLIVRMVRDRGVAEDLTQEVFVKALRSLDGYDHRRKFSSWIFKIAHNATIDHLRRGSLSTVPLEEPGSGSMDWLESIQDPRAVDPHEERERSELATLLESAIGELRPAYREVMLLRHREEHSYREIAEITSMSLGAVKTNLHRARRELTTILRDRGLSPDDVARA